MKKTLLTAIILATVTISFAQVNFGLRGGVNLANYANLEHSSKKADYYVGAMLSIKLGNVYTLQPEFTYSRQGTKLDKGVYTNFVSEKLNVSYLSIAIANKFSAANKVHFIIGPYFDIVMDKNVKFKNPDYSDSYYYDYNNVTPVDLGVLFGLGFDVSDNLTFEARYKQGFIGVIDNFQTGDSSYYSNGGSHLNKVFQLGLTYKFDLKTTK